MIGSLTEVELNCIAVVRDSHMAYRSTPTSERKVKSTFMGVAESFCIVL